MHKPFNSLSLSLSLYPQFSLFLYFSLKLKLKLVCSLKEKMMMMTEMSDQKRRYHNDGFMLSTVQASEEGGCSTKRVKTGAGSISPKEKKDKVGERVAALQQLVSPFGKTDTASVLQEATGYIKFLHEQLQVLSAPYLRTGPDGNIQDEEHCILRSRGLCLMPISSTLKIARSNGADLWAPTNASSR
ncbi:transcription factor bHLH113-like [Asparagus officinalis]|uniref:transcription factor bHLH113-like n=1 Tax=Asparagus officinalis TaxID=4686 RepID=UPI00098DF12E|nr:transcription factor bHLH113-like [Asparagus officinalis]